MDKNVPENGKALVLSVYSSEVTAFQYQVRPIPTLKDGQVLLKMHAASINPSDLMFFRGLYGIKKKLPVVPGFEGSGTVLEVRGNSEILKPGMRVSCVAGMGDGTYAEYMVTDIANCIPLLDSVSLEEGAMFFVNPLTAYALFEIARSKGSKGIVQTAAASALGKMIIRLGNAFGIKVLNIVRKSTQVEELKKEGAEQVLDSSQNGFEKEYLRATRKGEYRIILDAVGGEVASKIFTLSPYATEMISYGNLSEDTFSLQPGIFIFQKKTITGFWLSTWLGSLEKSDFEKHTGEAQKLLSTTLKSKVHKIFPLKRGMEAIEYYKTHMSDGKILIKPED